MESLDKAKVFLAHEVAAELAHLRGVRDAAVSDYQTVHAWVGRNHWWIMPSCLVIGWLTGHFWR